MSSKYLGDHFDIHCDGIDAIPVHHTNEIAQSEAASGKKPWVNYWCHGEFLLNDKGKMSKSSGEFLTLSVLESKGYDALDYRYFCLSGHYRSQLKFSFEALDHAKSARESLVKRVAELKNSSVCDLGQKAQDYKNQFFAAMENDLMAPQALAVLWSMLKDKDVTDGEKLALVLEMDQILGLRLDEVKPLSETKDDIPEDVKALALKRAQAKKEKNFALADEIRNTLKDMGYIVKDTPQGPVLERV